MKGGEEMKNKYLMDRVVFLNNKMKFCFKNSIDYKKEQYEFFNLISESYYILDDKERYEMIENLRK
jgi:hypothetical protein